MSRPLRGAAGWPWLVLVLSLLWGGGCASLPPTSLATHDSSIWEKEIAAFEAADRRHPPAPGPILFVGSSSIRMWKTLAEDFPGRAVINRGFGGSQLADSVRFADRIVVPCHPREVVVYAGANDLNAGKPPEVVYGDFVCLMRTLRARLPDARLAYISIAPNPSRWAQVDKIREVNRLAARYCRGHGIDFIDVFPLMLGPDGQPKPDIYLADRLHMNPKGYAIWREAIQPRLP